MSRAPQSSRSTAALRGLGLAAALTLASCGSAPPTRYHTLMPAAGSGPSVGAAAVSWTMAGVAVPAQVDQPQWVVRLPDDSMRLLEQERWVAPLADELQGAFGEALARRLGAPGLTKPASGKTWRVRVDVQRFDSAPSQHATIVADWTIASSVSTSAPDLRCRDTVRQAVPAGIPALAAAHRQAIVQIGDRIASALTALDAGTAARCPG